MNWAPPKIHVEALSPNVTVLGGGSFREGVQVRCDRKGGVFI